MQRKKIFNYVLSILSIILLLVLGLIALIDGSLFASSLSLIAGIFLILIGSTSILGALFSSTFMLGAGWKVITGIFSIIMGVFFLINREISLYIITMLFSFFVLFTGVIKFVRSFDLKNLKVKTWFIDLILGLLYIVLGVVLMIFSDESAEVVRILLGIILILSALFNLFDFIDSIIRSKRDERVIKTIKKHIDEADHIDIDFTK